MDVGKRDPLVLPMRALQKAGGQCLLVPWPAREFARIPFPATREQVVQKR